MMIPSYVTVGADPEGFILCPKGGVVSAIPIFAGTKDKGSEPLACKEGRVIHDNIAVEFSMQPAKTAPEFGKRVRKIANEIEDLVVARAGAGHRVLFDIGMANASRAMLKHPDAKTFGCDPDLSAWDEGVPNHKPRPKGTMRVAGGHVHIGKGRVSPQLDSFLDTFEGKVEFIKLCDIYLGQYIALLEKGHHGNAGFVQRRTLYGAAGAYRPKEYGVEYRSPSAVWVEAVDGPETVFNIVNYIGRLVATDGDPPSLVKRCLKKHKVTERSVRTSVNSATPIRSVLQELGVS